MALVTIKSSSSSQTTTTPTVATTMFPVQNNAKSITITTNTATTTGKKLPPHHHNINTLPKSTVTATSNTPNTTTTTANANNTLANYQRNTRNIIRFIVILCSLSLCSYQVYIVSLLYFRYPTTVDIRLDPSPFVQLPGVTVCSELSSTVLVEKLVKIQPKLYDTFAGKTRTEISLMLQKQKMRNLLLHSLHSLPIDQQHRMTVGAGKFFHQCQVPTPLGRMVRNAALLKSSNGSSSSSSTVINEKGNINESNTTTSSGKSISNRLWRNWITNLQAYSMINCTQFAPIIETISWDFKCFTLFHNHSEYLGDFDYQIPKDVVSNLKYLAWMRLNRDFIYNGLIYIHPPDLSHQFGSTSNIQQIDPDQHEFVSIAFERQTIQLLPPPYETKCHNYRQNGYTCRDDCMTRCKVARYLALDGWPGDVFAGVNVTNYQSKLWANTWSQSGHLEEGVNAESLATCSTQCGHRDDCNSVQYDVRTVRVKERDEDDEMNSHSFTVGLLPPRTVQLINRHVPKFEPIEFLIYIGSLVSLYLGVSFLSFGVGVLSCVTFTSKYQANNCLMCCNGVDDGDDDNDNDDDANESRNSRTSGKKSINDNDGKSKSDSDGKIWGQKSSETQLISKQKLRLR